MCLDNQGILKGKAGGGTNAPPRTLTLLSCVNLHTHTHTHTRPSVVTCIDIHIPQVYLFAKLISIRCLQQDTEKWTVPEKLWTTKPLLEDSCCIDMTHYTHRWPLCSGWGGGGGWRGQNSSLLLEFFPFVGMRWNSTIFRSPQSQRGLGMGNCHVVNCWIVTLWIAEL